MELTKIENKFFREFSTHCENCWSGKSWWHLKTEKDRRLFYCVVLWYQGEALLKIRASGTGGGGGATYAPMPHQPIKHNKTIADLFLSLNVTNFFRFNNLHNALKDLWRRILQFSLIQLYYWLFINISLKCRCVEIWVFAKKNFIPLLLLSSHQNFQTFHRSWRWKLASDVAQA